jgi:RHS repeat-associated protein
MYSVLKYILGIIISLLCGISCFASNLLHNSDFSTVATYWQTAGNSYGGFQYNSNACCNYHSPSAYAYTIGPNGFGADNINATLSQVVNVPLNTGSGYLDVWTYISTNEPNPSSPYDFLYITLTDGINSFQHVLSNADYSSGYTLHHIPINNISDFSGHVATLTFHVINDSYGPTLWRLDDIVLDVSVNSSGIGGCSNWYNGASPNAEVNTAVEFLCQNNVIDASLDAFAVYSNPAKKKDVAKLIYNSLFGQGGNAPSDYFPSPFVDISLLTQSEQQACKALLYLDYTDGIAPFSREYYFIGADLPFSKKGECLRALLEAWNIAPDWSGFSPFGGTSFYYDVSTNDLNYGWIKKAFDIGLLNNLPLINCSNQCFEPNISFNLAQVYVLIYRLIQNGQTPNVSYTDFFYPNNFSLNNINNKAGLDRAVFSTYEDASFNIPGGGLPLTFSHSYNSDLTELPFLPDEFFFDDYPLQLQSVFPLGVGWNHSYNIFITSIKNYVGGVFNEEKLAVHWPDGSVYIYDKFTQAFSTPGIKDQFTILSQTGNGFAQTIEIVKPDGLKFHFELEPAQGLLHLYSITDRNSNSIFLTYQWGVGNAGVTPLRLYQVTDNVSSRSITINYAPNSNFISSVSDPIGRVIFYSVDPVNHDLLSFADAKNQITHYQYGGGIYKHLLTSIQRPKGNTITNNYQQRKLNSSQNNAYSVQVSFSPNYLSNSQTSTSSVSVFQGGQAHTTSYTHDSRGNPTSIISATQNISIIYDPVSPDLPSYINDNLTGIAKQFQYDNSDNVIYGGTVSSGSVIAETNYYNAFNLVTDHVDANGYTTHYTYDNQGNLLRTDEPDSVITHFAVNSNGNVTQKIDPSGIITNYSYNPFGNLNSINIQGTSISASAVYDGISRINSITNTKGIGTLYFYDNNNNVTDELFDPNGLHYTSHYVYDLNDNLTEIHDPRQLVTSLIYDFDTDDLLAENYGSFSKQWTYNNDGTTNTFTSKNGAVFQYTYYPLSDVSRAGLLQSDGYTNYDYYATTKQPYKVTRSGYELTYNYDGFQRIASVAYNDLPYNIVSYNYDNNGNTTKITYPFNTNWQITYEWSPGNRLTGIKDWNGNYLAKYFYRKNGQIDYELLGNGTHTHYHYDTGGRLDSIYTLTSGGIPLVKIGAQINNAGEHTRETYFVALIDTAGIISEQPTSPSVYNYSAMNRLDNTDQGIYQYDNNGNVIFDAANGTQYTWDEHDNMLSSVFNGTTKFCEYDPLENRRKYDTTRYALDILGQSNVLVETDLNGNPRSLYVHGLGLVCRIDPLTDSVFYYHYDFRGSTVAITNDSQQVIAKYEYEPFGFIVDRKEPVWYNGYTYVGKYGVARDAKNLYYMRARYYEPIIARFLGEDPIWSYNLFTYAENNPITNIDPKGTNPLLLAAIEMAPAIAIYANVAMNLIVVGISDAYENFKSGKYIAGSLDVLSIAPPIAFDAAWPKIAGKLLETKPGRIILNSKLKDWIRPKYSWIPNKAIMGPKAKGAQRIPTVSGGGKLGKNGEYMGFHYHIHKYNWYKPWTWFDRVNSIK